MCVDVTCGKALNKLLMFFRHQLDSLRWLQTTDHWTRFEKAKVRLMR